MDRIDKKILEVLQADGRISNQELADQVALSPSPCLRRVKQLEEDGYIRVFKHTAEGKDDMPAHIRTILTQTSLSIPIQNNKLALGTWQGVYLYEHRYAPQQRNLLITVIG